MAPETSLIKLHLPAKAYFAFSYEDFGWILSARALVSKGSDKLRTAGQPTRVKLEC